MDKIEAINLTSGGVDMNYMQQALCNQSLQLHSHDQQPKQGNRGDFSKSVYRCCGRVEHFARICAARILSGPGPPPDQAAENINSSSVTSLYMPVIIMN